MYDKWIIKKWDTELYELTLDFVSLEDSDKLKITVKTMGSDYSRYEIVFFGSCSYRVIDEGCRNQLWEHISKNKIDDATGFTWKVENGDFFNFLMKDDVFSMAHSDSIHYVIATINNVVEVINGINERQPEIRKIG